MKTVDKIEKDLSSKDLSGITFKLSPCETIIDARKFVDSHIAMLKGNPGNARFMPYFERLNKFYLSL